jgi:hypothetical protein
MSDDAVFLLSVIVVVGLVIGVGRLLVGADRKKKNLAPLGKSSGAGKKGKRPDASVSAKRGEALFKSMFPDLQPHFHPARLVDFVRGRQAKPPPGGKGAVSKPAGFDAASAEVSLDAKGREQWRFLDAAGVLVTQLAYEDHPEGAALRVGRGKFTVNLLDKARPWVRYWHSEREFRWRDERWTFQSRMAESSIDSSPEGSSFSSDSRSSSSSSAATAAAGAAALVAAGGTFDGGGASASWDGERGGGRGDAGAGFDSVSSGSSTSADPGGSSDFSPGDSSGSSDSSSGDSGGGTDSGSGSDAGGSSTTAY